MATFCKKVTPRGGPESRHLDRHPERSPHPSEKQAVLNFSGVRGLPPASERVPQPPGGIVSSGHSKAEGVPSYPAESAGQDLLEVRESSWIGRGSRATVAIVPSVST